MSTESTQAEAQVHLLAIRRALANRNAAVMVGAGFSRNAEGGQNLATWRELSEALANELEPERTPGAFSPSAAAQLAEQYARVFSPTHLEQLIKRCVPDDQVAPGPLHASLLELPWAEVFTTNYDTLLERAADRLFDASYLTVCAREDIPQSKILGRRRIVKLHGSFPSHRPFILTEEEYRTYPERFAPFVNLVRQSLLENVFCLIGFSGDDPNFLHWLGWVRDMLDRHALPVYLFLGREPTLGERKLYEARGVIPVVLPTPADTTVDDYQARYHALFTELAKPLADSPLDWGDFPTPQELDWSSNTDQHFTQLAEHLPVLRNYRVSYPGWLVAPQKIRAKFRRTANWLQRSRAQGGLARILAQRPALVTLAILELYGWVQHVMLEPWDDGIAELARRALSESDARGFGALTLEEKEFLLSMGCDEAATQQTTRINTSLALLSWARQGHRTEAYHEVRAQLQSMAPNDAAVQERLAYEDILQQLQRGNQPGALKQLIGWRPKGSDAYVHVLRGSLLAEVGETASALQVLEQAIQVLRRQQRSQPGNPALISQEAWACLIARNIQRVLEFSARLNTPSSGKSATEPDDAVSENFEHRLNALGARGYSARQELESVMASLNAEAPLPHATRGRFAGSGRGEGLARRPLTHTSELSDKVNAGLGWLELVERTGLPPRTKNTSFFAEQMLQAAWWSRLADTPQRSFGLLLRAQRKNALNPRDDAFPPHRSGWLGRDEVARFSAQSALELCTELLTQVRAEIGDTGAPSDRTSRVDFLLEVFSHLVIRVEPEETLARWGSELLELHRTAPVRAHTILWKPLSSALSSIIEALPSAAQLLLILQACKTPSPASTELRIPEREFAHWLDFNKLLANCDWGIQERSVGEWRPIVETLIQQLRLPTDNKTAKQTWRRLIALRQQDLLSNAEQKEVSEILWAHSASDKWPEIPGFSLSAPLVWATARRNAAATLFNRLMKHPLRPFNSAGYMVMTFADGARSYHLGGLDTSLGALRHAMSETSLTLTQIEKFIRAVNEWLEAQLNDLVLDLGDEQLANEVFRAVEHLDEMLALCVDLLVKRTPGPRTTKLLDGIEALNARLRPLKAPRYRLKLALIRSGKVPTTELEGYVTSVVSELATDDSQVLWRAATAAYELLDDENPKFRGYAKTLFNAVVACVFAQRTACMNQTMNLLANLPALAWSRNLDQTSLFLLDAALSDLGNRLDYSQDASTGVVFDELIPTLRLRACELSYALVHGAKVHSQAAQRWLSAAGTDPLPEVRLGRFKRVVKEVETV